MVFMNLFKKKSESFIDKELDSRKLSREEKDREKLLMLRAKNQALKESVKARRELLKEKALLKKQEKELFDSSTKGKLFNASKRIARDINLKIKEKRKANKDKESEEYKFKL